jgi:hypothetical protein
MIAFSVTAVVSPLARASSGWVGDYETGDFAQWGIYHVQANPGDAAIVTSPVRKGHYAARFAVDPGDNPINSSGERAQIYANQAVTEGYEGREQWWAWSSMLAPGSVLAHGKWNNLTAWHHTGPTCSAPLHFALDDRRNLRLDARGGQLNETTCSSRYQRTWRLGRISTGRWYDFVFHVKWSPDPAIGFVEVYLNGKLVLPRRHAATLYTGLGVYLKQGFHRAATTSGSTIVYNDCTRRATSYRGAISAFPARAWPSKRPRSERARRRSG